MAAMSDYLEAKIIDHLFRTATFAKPTVIAIAIGLVTPTDATTGAWANEVPNTFNYGRQTLNPLDTNWDPPSGNNGTTKNAVPIVFGPATGGNWGAIAFVMLIDNATFGAGNAWFWGALTNPVTINDGQGLTFATGDLQIQIDD